MRGAYSTQREMKNEYNILVGKPGWKTPLGYLKKQYVNVCTG
jgi:hypothetical protein